MPITPHFELSQSLTHVIVEIRVPHVRVSVDSVEIVVDDCTLHFSSPPYLLVLTFPAAIVDNSEGAAKYDPSRNGGMITLNIQKKEAAMWPGLDLMGALMTPKKNNSGTRAVPGIELLHEEQDDNADTQDDDQQDNDASIPDIRNALRPHYGFLNLHSAVFTDLAREGLAAEMLQLPNPDTTPAEDRRILRMEKEVQDFDANRYLGDVFVEDDYIYQTAMQMQPHWRQHGDGTNVEHLTQRISQLSSENDDNDNSSSTPSAFFTPEESAQLAFIPYPLLPNDISLQQDESLLFGLLDILFAYVYDHIMTDGDPTIESSWAVCILSSTLSWLDTFHDASLELVVRHCIRRALVYPYLRNYELALYCWNQVLCILKHGRRCIVRCLLQVRGILNKSECHYLGNRLYIDPYLAWIQRHVTNDQVTSLCGRLEVLLKQAEQGKVLGKESLGLNLLELERLLEQDVEEDSDESSESESDDESSDDENDSISSSSEEEEEEEEHDNGFLDNDQTPTSSELLDSELGNGIQALTLSNADADEQPSESPSSPTKKPLIEEL